MVKAGTALVFYNWVLRLLLPLPAVALLWFSVPLVLHGWALNEAFPTTTYIEMNVPQPQERYAFVASRLADSDPRDGDTFILRGKALAHIGRSDEAISLLGLGLSHAPASVGGWATLAALEAQSHSPSAPRMLDMALSLGVYDYWVAEQRAGLAIQLWPRLSADAQAHARRQVSLFWTEKPLRPRLMSFLSLPGGPDAMDRAFANEPETIRAINRWEAEQVRFAARLRYERAGK